MVDFLVLFLADFSSYFFLCLLFVMIIMVTKNKHIYITADTFEGPQKIHKNSIPRIGGIAIVLSLLVHIFLIDIQYKQIFTILILSGLPVFIVGLTEDITKAVKPMYRLMSSCMSGLLATYLLSLQILSTNIILIDITLSIWIIPFFLAMFSITLLSQSFNIIDGLNGLAIGISIIILMSVLYLAVLFYDTELVYLSILFLSCFFGFFVFNFFTGKIFLGDGGAYFIGYISACLVLTLAMRHQMISPFAILLIVFYPIYETLRSFFRRVFSRKLKYFEADSKHFHSILNAYFSLHCKHKNQSTNSFSALLILIVIFCFNILAISFYQDNNILLSLLFLFIFVYEISIRFLNLKTN
ncbi:glycosyltransferase [Alphaproteobacteria bacterium]|nr:glycosyltransferase [Alphaproteobacteria bacterium]